MGCQVETAGKIVAHGAGFVLALKGNHPSFEAAVKSYFDSAPPEELATRSVVEKGHGRIETRIASASSAVDWIKGAKSDPRQPRLPHIKTLLRMVNRTEYKDKCTTGTRYFISSAPLDIDRLADAVRGHWGVESMGVSRACTGCSMPPFTATCRATVLATGLRTWQPSGASQWAWCAPTKPKAASKPAENPPDGIHTSSSKSFKSNDR